MKKHINYQIKFMRHVNGVWDGKFRTTTILAPNQYQAVYKLGEYNNDSNVENIIVMVESLTGNLPLLLPGRTYETVSGKTVKMEKYVDITDERTICETLCDENSHHRYSRRDIGRCTGSALNCPDNIQLGVFWVEYDPDNDYDFISEKKYSYLQGK